MRRLFSLAVAVGLLGTAVGCHILHGICDCDNQLGMGTPTAPVTAPPPIVGPIAPTAALVPTPVLTPKPVESIPSPAPAPAPK